MNQAVSKKNNECLSFYEGYIEVMGYEQKLDETFKIMNTAITEKVAILKLMKSRVIELDKLIALFDNFMHEFETLKRNLNELFSINS